MDNTNFDYLKAKLRYVLDNELWDEKNEKLKKKVYDVYGIRNEKHSDTGGIYNGEMYVSGFRTKKPKPRKITECRICFKPLVEKQREYCGDPCRVSNNQLRNKMTELNSKNKHIETIYWKKDPDGKPHRKNIIGTTKQNGTYETIENIITKKSGKTRNKDHKTFSKGKDYEQSNLDKTV